MDLPEPLDDAPHHLLPVPLLRRPRRHLELGLQAGHCDPLRVQEIEETVRLQIVNKILERKILSDKVYKTVAALGSAATAFFMGRNGGDININSPHNDCSSTNVVVHEAQAVQEESGQEPESGPVESGQEHESGPSESGQEPEIGQAESGQAKKKKPSSTKKNDSRKASLAQASKTKNKGDLSDIRAAQRTLRRQAKRKMESNGKLDKKIPKKKK